MKKLKRKNIDNKDNLKTTRLNKRFSLPELGNTQTINKKVDDLKKVVTNPSIRRLNLKRYSLSKNADVSESKPFGVKFNMAQTVRALEFGRNIFHKTDSKSTERLFFPRNHSEISLHAQKENEIMQKSLNFLNRGGSAVVKDEK